MTDPIDLAIAQYPGSFKACAVTKDKICMQFNEVPSKLRLLGTDGNQLPKGKGGLRYVELSQHPQSFGVSAVGCYMPILEQTQWGLIEAYQEYLDKFSDEYKKKYNKEFKDFLISIRDSLSEVIGD